MFSKMATVKYTTCMCLLLQMRIVVLASEASLQEAIFHLSNGTSLGMSVLQAPGTVISRGLCALECVSWETECYSFTYNSETGLCALGTQVSRDHPTIPPEQGDLYIKDGCNSIGGFELWEDQLVSLCVFVSDDSLNFADAQKSCADMGAYLVKLTDLSTFDLFKSILEMETEEFWVGIDDREEEGLYVWSNDGSPVENVNSILAFMFRNGQPDNYGGIDDCIAYYQGLYDDICGKHLRYVCQRSL